MRDLLSIHPLGMLASGMKCMRFEDVQMGMGVGSGSVRDVLSVCAVRPKLWIGAALGVAGGLASSLIGGAAASSAARAAERRQREQESKEGAWYLRRYNEDYVDTAAGQNLVRRAKDYAREQWKKASGAQAVAGGTDAATAMAKEAGNKMVGDTIANIAATDQSRKDNVDNMHRQAEAQFAQMDMNRELQRAQNITNAAQNASNAMMSAGAAIDQPKLTGSDNKGVPVSGAGLADAYKQVGAGEERLRQLNAGMPWL